MGSCTRIALTKPVFTSGFLKYPNWYILMAEWGGDKECETGGSLLSWYGHLQLGLQH